MRERAGPLAGALALLVSALPLSALQGPGIPPTDEARLELRELIFAPLFEAAAAPSRIVAQPSGGPVLFRTQRQAGALYLEFTPGGGLPATSGPGGRPGAITPSQMASAGTFIIKRSLADGAFVQAKVFFQDDPGCFIRLAPLGGRTTMEVTLFGRPWQRGVVLAASFDSLLTAPLSRIERLSGASVDWAMLEPAAPTGADLALQRLAARARQDIRGMHYVEDGAMDASGRWVTISDQAPQTGSQRGCNCSGFAKWFVDGFYAPLAGTLTDIATLKARDTDVRGNSLADRYEVARDPWFGLDWSRNLATALARAQGGAAAGSAERCDVRDVPGFRYTEDVGYPIDDLAAMLWLLDRRSPGAVYLGSISRDLGGDPPLRQHHHLAVLVPFVDAAGTFQVGVFESATETSLASLQKRFPSEFVHLVRLDAAGSWNPPRVE